MNTSRILLGGINYYFQPLSFYWWLVPKTPNMFESNLGCVCFGGKHFQEIIFRKIGCLVGFENRIFWKSFSFNRKKEALTTEIHFRSYFHFKWFPERERERERERSRLWRRRRTPSSSPTIARTRLHWSHRSQYRAARSHELQFDDRMHQIASVSSIAAPCRSHHAVWSCRSISPSISPPRDLAFDLPIFDPPIYLFVWFWFLLLLWWCGGGVLVVVAFDCRSLLPWVELEFRCFIWEEG